MAQEPCTQSIETAVVASDEETSRTCLFSDHTAVENGEISERSASESGSYDHALCRNMSLSRLNAQAREFVPRTPVPSGSCSSPFWNNSQSQISNRSDLQSIPHLTTPQGPPIHIYPQAMSQNSPLHPTFHVPAQNPCTFQHLAFFEQELVHPSVDFDSSSSKDALTEEITQKIVKQVEFYFSDANLATTDHLMRFISKDPEGFVPISVIASFKKIKAFVSNQVLLAAALRTSSKLVVSEDGKKVRRQHPLTDTDVEDLQSRTVVAENLPEDHSHQNLEKIFCAVGSVKTIRICHPQNSNGGASVASRSPKMDMLVSNKLHALVEYETIEQAEKAVSELNDERNWRSGLRVRLLLRRTTKSTAQIRGRKAGQEGENGEEDDVSTSEQADDTSHQPSELSNEHMGEESVSGKDGGSRRGRARGRGKARGHGQHHNNRGGYAVGTPPSNNLIQNEHPTVTKQPPGPRMPDGTRGFTMGRGKPLDAAVV